MASNRAYSTFASRVLSISSACAIALGPSAALARGGHGGGGHGGGGHSSAGGTSTGNSFGGGGSGGGFGGTRSAGAGFGGAVFGGAFFGGALFGGSAAEGTSFVGRAAGERPPIGEVGGAVDFGRFGAPYDSYLYIGPTSAWSAAHWGSGFWAARSTGGWAWYTGPWWVSPEYPGWVWMGPPWVWDGEQIISQEGYWTTVNMPEGAPAPDFVEVEPK